MKKYKNEELEKAVAICKENEIKAYAFQKETISQIFAVDADGNIGTVSALWGGVTYATVHKGSREHGSGFCLSGENEIASIERIKECMLTVRPNWARGGSVEKYKSWEDYLLKPINRILKYYEL